MFTRRKAGIAFVFLAGMTTLSSIASAQESISVSTGYDVTQGFWLVTKEKGFDASNGLELSVKVFEAGATALESMLAGEAVATGTIGGLPALRGKSRGADFVAVASALRAPLISCAAAQEAIKTPADLSGQTVGLLLGSSSQFWWSRFAAFHKIENATLKSLTPPETVSALHNGEIAAFFNWQPWCTRAQEIVPNAHLLALGGDNDLQPFADAMILFRGDFVRDRREVAANLLKAVKETLAWIAENPDEAAEIMAKTYRSDAGQFASDIKGIEWKLTMTNWLVNYLYEQAAWMKEQKLIEPDDTNALVDSLLYPAVLAQVDPSAVDIAQ